MADGEAPGQDDLTLALSAQHPSIFTAARLTLPRQNSNNPSQVNLVRPTNRMGERNDEGSFGK
jgi:hypothetical protein